MVANMKLDMFKKFFHSYLKAKGFEKIKNEYYMNGKEFLCMIDLQRSSYGPTYYINYTFFLGEFEKPYVINTDSIETYTPYVGNRFYFAENNKYSCDYLEYTEEELTSILDFNFNERVAPPFEKGKKYLLDNFGNLYESHLKDEIIIPILKK